jgi:hypothetical protein
MSDAKRDNESAAPRRGSRARAARRGAAPRPAFGAGAEGLCGTMPEVGSLPFKCDSARKRQLVRLVSISTDSSLGGGSKLSIELQPGENRIGRQRTNNHIVLVSPQVSRFHAQINVGEESIVLRDLGSANGTFVNSERITTTTLSAGDLVAFSDHFTMRLMIDLVLEEPESLTLQANSAEAPTLPPETDEGGIQSADSLEQKLAAELDRESVPPSLEERLQRSSPELDIRSLEPPASPSRPLRIASRPVEVSAGQVSAARPGSPVRPPKPIPTPEPLPPPPASPADAPTTPWPEAARAAPQRSAPWPSTAPDTDEDPPALLASPNPPDHAVQEDTHAGAERVRRGADPADLRTERERQQLKALYQVSKRCMAAKTLDELDTLLVGVLERAVNFIRGFITYQLPNGDWKLVLSPAGQRWERQHVRQTVQLALRTRDLLRVSDSRQDTTLGANPQGLADSRLLLPLRSRGGTAGALFLLGRVGAFDDDTADFLSLFGDIAALALANCAHRELTGGGPS